MTAASTVRAGRRAAEALMVDTCTIDRITGEATGEDGRVTPTYADPPPYAGKCKLQTYEPYEQTPEVGGSTPTVQRYSLHVPVTAGPLEVGDVATVGARRFRIAGLHRKSFQTAQRLLVDEITTAEGA
jgi:hypothetical protein